MIFSCSKMEIARWETESCSPRHPLGSHCRKDQHQLDIYLCPKDASLVHINQRIKVGKVENPDLAKTGAHGRKPFDLGFCFPSLSNQGGRHGFWKRGLPVGTSRFNLLLCHIPFRPLHPATWRLHLRCGTWQRGEQPEAHQGPHLLVFQPREQVERPTWRK